MKVTLNYQAKKGSYTQFREHANFLKAYTHARGLKTQNPNSHITIEIANGRGKYRIERNGWIATSK